MHLWGGTLGVVCEDDLLAALLAALRDLTRRPILGVLSLSDVCRSAGKVWGNTCGLGQGIRRSRLNRVFSGNAD